MILPPGAALNIRAARQLLRNLVPPDRLRNYFIDHVTHKVARACSSGSREDSRLLYTAILYLLAAHSRAPRICKKEGLCERANINRFPLRGTSRKMIFRINGWLDFNPTSVGQRIGYLVISGAFNECHEFRVFIAAPSLSGPLLWRAI